MCALSAVRCVVPGCPDGRYRLKRRFGPEIDRPIFRHARTRFPLKRYDSGGSSFPYLSFFENKRSMWSYPWRVIDGLGDAVKVQHRWRHGAARPGG